jgi:UDP-N-acetylglucosamine--N-acetylmuramyl-(pentapeptide) pyrophosphoryl-undecaprenol N-acetylglucosamine transferase
MSAPLIMLAAGGTGGHVYPGLALAEELRRRGYRLRWMGTRRGLEDRVVTAAGIPLHHLPMRGLRGKSLPERALAVLLLAVSLLQSLWLFLRFRPRLLVAMGGYVTVPAGLAAFLLRRPLLLQEQNAVAGSANRLLAPLSAAIATGFPGVFAGRSAAHYTGNPLRRDLLEVADREPWNWRGERPLRVLVLGGSLGAQALNNALPDLVQTLGLRCEWWHQCGNAHIDETRRHYDERSIDTGLRLEPFVDDMAAAYGWADLVLCRAGALSVAELAVTGRPALLVPLPGAIDDHQTANARFLADAGAAWLLPQPELAERLQPLLEELLAAPERLAAAAAAALRCARPQATAVIADHCEACLR